jgi:hypothetical protein
MLVGLTEHASNQIDVDLRKVERARFTVDAIDLRRAMRPAVQFEDAIVEVLDAKTQTGDADLTDG